MKRLLLAFLLFFSFAAQAQIIPSIPYNLTNGSLADATQVMGNFNTIVTDVNVNSATNGANTNITSLTGLTTPLAPTYGGTVVYTGGTTAGTTNAQTLATVTPSNFALTAGNLVTGIAGFTNSGAMTLSVAGGAATAVDKLSPSGITALTGGEIVAGQLAYFYFDGTVFELITSPPGNVANSQLALMSANTMKGNLGPGNRTPQDLTTTQVQTLISSFVSVHRQTFTGGGTYTPCTGLLYADMEVWGGGGGGGGVTATGEAVAAGGGAGGYAKKVASASTVGSSQTVTIGTSGGAGSNSGGTGGTGGTTSIGALVSASGGIGGTGNTSATVGVNGGAGGAGSSGDINTTGQAGFPSTSSASASGPTAGSGGSTSLGGGGQGLSVGPGSFGGNGGVANSGSGGGGAGNNNAAPSASAGGPGGTGFASVTEYCNR